jgi:hypothetical protein
MFLLLISGMFSNKIEDLMVLVPEPLTGKVVLCLRSLEQWYSTFFVRVPPDIISL